MNEHHRKEGVLGHKPHSFYLIIRLSVIQCICVVYEDTTIISDELSLVNSIPPIEGYINLQVSRLIKKVRRKRQIIKINL